MAVCPESNLRSRWDIRKAFSERYGTNNDSDTRGCL